MKKTVSVLDIVQSKGKKRVVMITCYDFTMARIINSADIDIILVGDSAGVVMAGADNTIPVTMEQMVYHTKCVTAAKPHALVIGDMPFMSYQASVEDAVRNAGRLMKEGGAGAVKLEGGIRMLEQVRAIVKSDIPVMGHLGLTPQSVHAFGGHKVQGRGEQAVSRLIEDALALQEAGAFAIVLECVPVPAAKKITERLSIPTIGIGAGNATDGQVLVIQDMLGMFKEFKPKFAKRYAELFDVISNAVGTYAAEVRSGAFPDDAHSFLE